MMTNDQRQKKTSLSTPNQACNRQNLFCVPLYDSLGENAVQFILEHSTASAVFVAADKLAPLAAAAPPSQLNIHYTQTPGTLSIDFVSASADGTVEYGTSANPASFTNASTTSFAFDEVGVLHQGLLPFAASPAGASAFYRVCSAGECSAVLHVVPNVAPGKERFAVYGDFGIINDESMTDLIAEAAKGSYDSVLHVGDWAYDLDALASTVGNVFMATATYMAIKPVAVVEGNHESCGFCLQNVPEIPYSVGNFTVRLARGARRARPPRSPPPLPRLAAL